MPLHEGRRESNAIAPPPEGAPLRRVAYLFIALRAGVPNRRRAAVSAPVERGGSRKRRRQAQLPRAPTRVRRRGARRRRLACGRRAPIAFRSCDELPFFARPFFFRRAADGGLIVRVFPGLFYRWRGWLCASHGARAAPACRAAPRFPLLPPRSRCSSADSAVPSSATLRRCAPAATLRRVPRAATLRRVPRAAPLRGACCLSLPPLGVCAAALWAPAHLRGARPGRAARFLLARAR